MGEHKGIGFQTPNVRYLDPQNIPSKHQTSGGMAGRLGYRQKDCGDCMDPEDRIGVDTIAWGILRLSGLAKCV